MRSRDLTCPASGACFLRPPEWASNQTSVVPKMANEVDPDNVLAVKNAFPGELIGLPHTVLNDGALNDGALDDGELDGGEQDGNLVVLNMTFA